MASLPLARGALRLKRRVPASTTGRCSGDRPSQIKFQAEWDRPVVVVQVGGVVRPVHLESKGKSIGKLRITICPVDCLPIGRVCAVVDCQGALWHSFSPRGFTA